MGVRTSAAGMEAGCVVHETGVLDMLIELLEVLLKGTVTEPA